MFKPKVVQFKNGSYGYRRWRLFGYEFLSNYENYWWSFPTRDNLRLMSFVSIEALAAHVKLIEGQELKDKLDKIADYGTPIKRTKR
jgi:hypothetical protein